MIPKFSLGMVVAKEDAALVIDQSGQDWDFFLERHAAGDWGDVDELGWRANDEALANGGLILSKYRTLRGWGILVLTRPDRSETTIFLPPVNHVPLYDRACWRREGDPR
jgi:hypothetical protein